MVLTGSHQARAALPIKLSLQPTLLRSLRNVQVIHESARAWISLAIQLPCTRLLVTASKMD